jgi:hypothetical protein
MMKKIWLGLISASIIAGSAVTGYSASTKTTQLTILITTGDLDIDVGPFTNFNDTGIVLGANPLTFISSGTEGTGSVGVRNFAGAKLKYSVSAAPNQAAATAGWVQYATATEEVPSKNYRLFGQFRDPDADPATFLSTDFTAEDLLTTTAQEATATVFALDSQLQKFKGYRVPNGEFRNLFFRLDMPSAANAPVTAPAELGINITVSAVLDTSI